MVVYLKSIENRYTGEVFTLEGMVRDKQTYFKSACEYLEGHIVALKHLIQKREEARNDNNTKIIDELIQVYQEELSRSEKLLYGNNDTSNIINFFFDYLNLKYDGIEVAE